MSPPDGRQRAARGVFAIEEEELLLRDPVALDTSFVVEALIATQPLHDVCRPFLTRVFESAASVVTSELLRVELAEARSRSHSRNVGQANGDATEPTGAPAGELAAF